MSDGLAQTVAALEVEAQAAATAGETAVVAAQEAIVLAEVQAAIVTAEAAETITEVVQTVKENKEETEWLRIQLQTLQTETALLHQSQAELKTMLAQALISLESQSQSSREIVAEVIPEVPLIPVALSVDASQEAQPQNLTPSAKRRHQLL